MDEDSFGNGGRRRGLSDSPLDHKRKRMGVYVGGMVQVRPSSIVQARMLLQQQHQQRQQERQRQQQQQLQQQQKMLGQGGMGVSGAPTSHAPFSSAVMGLTNTQPPIKTPSLAPMDGPGGQQQQQFCGLSVAQLNQLPSSQQFVDYLKYQHLHRMTDGLLAGLMQGGQQQQQWVNNADVIVMGMRGNAGAGGPNTSGQQQVQNNGPGDGGVSENPSASVSTASVGVQQDGPLMKFVGTQTYDEPENNDVSEGE